MTMIFPTEQPLSPHHPPLTGIFERRRELAAILSDISKGDFVALWAPRYAGRTSFLHYLEIALSRSEGEAAVYVSPENLRDLSTRASLFQSLSSHIQASLASSVVGNQEEPYQDNWDRPDALEMFLRRFLETRPFRRLTILLDDCDKLLSTSLVTLLRSLRDICGHCRDPRDPLLGLGFVVAGAVSFRNFKLLEQDGLSPFDDWSITHLHDLTESEARQYLESAFSAIDIEVETGAVDKLVEYAGGDLLRLNALGGSSLVPGKKLLTTADVSRTIHRLFRDYQSDSSIAYMLSVISHDPRCLDVVERMKRGETNFERPHLNRYQDQYFGISNQELSGGFLLIREGGKPLHWQVRNRFCRDVLINYFSNQRLVRAFLDLGRYDKIGHHIEQLARELAADFQADVLRFDESAVRDVIDWFWSRSFKSDRISIGLQAFEFVLERIFGIDEFTVYEADQDRSRLLRNEFLPSGQPSTAGDVEIDLDSSASPSREVRVFRSELYSAEIERGTHLRIVIPLRDYNERASGVLSFQTKRYMEPWATLFVRIPIIERAVNLIWPKLSRYESDQNLVFQNMARGVSSGKGEEARPVQGIPILIATKFGTDLHRYFKRNLARFPSSFDPRLLEFYEGFILERVLEAIKRPDSFLVFDLSNVNANVLFELGLAIGLNRPGLPAYEETYRTEPDILRGLLFATYKAGRFLGDNFFSRLQELWSSYLGHRDEPDFVHLLNCRVPECSSNRQYILVVDHNHFRDQNNFRKGVQVAAARVGMEVVYLWNSNDQLEVLGEEHMILTRSFRLIKEATAIVARVEKVEENRSCASRFVATGIAKGLKVAGRGCRHLSLVARSSRLGGEPIAVPSDLDGVGPIPFDSKSKGFSVSLERAFTEAIQVDYDRSLPK